MSQQLATFRTAAWRRMLLHRAIARCNRWIEQERTEREIRLADYLTIRAQRNAEAALNDCYAAFGVRPGLAGGRRHNRARSRLWCAVGRVAEAWGY